MSLVMMNHSDIISSGEVWSNTSSSSSVAEGDTPHQICWDGDASDDGGFSLTKLSLAVCQSLTLVLAYVYAIAIYKKIDVIHPVFAVVFQEVIVLCISSTVCFVSYLFTMAWYYKCWFVVLFHKVTLLLLQFHQSSWLVITCLRYHLIVTDDPEEINMNKLKSISLSAVWILFLVGLSIVTATFFIVRNFWITQMYDEIYRDLPSATKFIIHLAYISPANVPDLISISVYFRLLLHLRRRVTQVGIASANDDNANNLPPTSAAGAHMEVIDRVSNNSRSSTNTNSGASTSDRNSHPLSMEDQISAGDNNIPSNNSNQSNNETTLVLRSLTTHVAVALLDMCLPFSMYIQNKAAQHFILAHLLLTFAFWAPMLVVWRNFRQMGKMVKFYFDLVCT